MEGNGRGIGKVQRPLHPIKSSHSGGRGLEFIESAATHLELVIECQRSSTPLVTHCRGELLRVQAAGGAGKGVQRVAAGKIKGSSAGQMAAAQLSMERRQLN